MRYMLLMQAPPADWLALGPLAREDLAAHIAFVKDLDRQLEASGELVSEEGLAGPDQAKIVRARGDRAPAITSAPFPQAGAFLVRYWIVDCDSPARAVAIAARVSAAPGRNGAPSCFPVEVRQVMRAPGEEM